MTSSYRAAVCTDLKGPSALEVRALPIEPLPPGHVRIAVEAAGLNFPDLLMTTGGYQFRPDPPYVPGMEIAGDVLEVAADVQEIRPGDKVMAQMRLGGFAEQAIVPAEAVMPLPVQFSYEEGASWYVGATTAWHALHDKAQIQPGETLLVLGAAGGVGMAAVQLGRHLGARVIGLASTPEKCAAVLAAGAEAAFLNDQPDLLEAVRTAAGSKGVQVVYDPVGGPLAQMATRSFGWGGRYLIVGFASGEVPKFAANHVLIKGYTVMGLRAGEAGRQDPALGARNRAALKALAADGVMRPHISHRFSLEQAGEALQALADRQVTGRAVSMPGASARKPA